MDEISANSITATLLIEIPKRFPGARVWRRNVGRAVGLDTVKRAIGLISRGSPKEAIDLLQRRPITFGVNGESDIDGIMPPNGRRISIEVKAGGDVMRTDQIAFREMVLRTGGIHVVAKDPAQALNDLEAQLQQRN